MKKKKNHMKNGYKQRCHMTVSQKTHKMNKKSLKIDKRPPSKTKDHLENEVVPKICRRVSTTSTTCTTYLYRVTGKGVSIGDFQRWHTFLRKVLPFIQKGGLGGTFLYKLFINKGLCKTTYYLEVVFGLIGCTDT